MIPQDSAAIPHRFRMRNFFRNDSANDSAADSAADSACGIYSATDSAADPLLVLRKFWLVQEMYGNPKESFRIASLVLQFTVTLSDTP
jgi:hypothetical protein